MNAVEKVCSPSIRHVATFFQTHVVLVVISSHVDVVVGGSSEAIEELAGGKAHTQHLLCLGVVIHADVLAAGVSGVNPQFEIAPVLFLLCGRGECHAT